jgi:hypothetical protein
MSEQKPKPSGSTQPSVIDTMRQKVQQILTKEEKIRYIAVQNNPLNPVSNLTPDGVVLTNRRFIVYRPKLLGRVTFEDYIWRDLRDARLKEGIARSTITFKTVKGNVLRVVDLPKEAARRVYSLAQEMEEQVLEERRQREMEETRAAAGGVFLQGGTPAAPVPQAPPSPPPQPQEDPVQRLQQLKQMLDADLISQEEYDVKKNEILSRM